MAQVDHSPSSADIAALVGDHLLNTGPLYRSLANALRDLIGSDAFGAGDRLPSERGLADSLSLSRSTVVAAYEVLREEGLVSSRRGSGSVVVGTGGSALERQDGRVAGGAATSLLQRMVDPHAHENVASLGTTGRDSSPGLANELAGELAAMAGSELARLVGDAGYHPRGIPGLRAAVARHYEGLGLPTRPEQILVTNGATQAIWLAAQLYLRRNDTVVAEAPSWPGCTDLFRHHGASLVTVPLDSEGIRPDLLHAALSNHDVALLFVMPTFHNPTGTLMSTDRRRRVAELADRFRVPVIEDHSYPSDPSSQTTPLAAAHRHDRSSAPILSVSGLSKVVWGGLRIGWLRGPEDVIDRLARLRAVADMGSPVLEQALATRLVPRLGELTSQRELTRRERLQTLGRLLDQQLPAWRWKEPDGGSALWIELAGEDAVPFASLALREGVEVVPGRLTDPDGHHDTHIRLPFDYPAHTLHEVVQRLEQAWSELKGHDQA